MFNSTNLKNELVQYEYDTDYENEHDFDTEYIDKDPIDDFLSNYADNIIDLYYEIIHLFPYVLNDMNSSHLTSFIINHNYSNNYSFIHENYAKKYNKKMVNLFENEFELEIIESLKMVNNYTYNTITYDDWLYFLYNFANL
jgi:hypothetical protein